MNELEKEQEAALDEALTNLPNLLAKRLKLLEQREEELKKSFERLEREKKSLGCGNASDVLHLNVGGTPITTLRRTLTYVEDSMLAARFSGRWDDSIEKDKDGNFFIDQPIEIFLPMIDFIRSKQSQTPLASAPRSPALQDFGNVQKKYDDFKRMVEYFGATLVIFPVELVDYTTSNKQLLASFGPSSSFKASFSEWKICGLVPSGHTRKIKAFAFKIGEAVNLQIGWVTGAITANTAIADHAYGSIALDLARGGITCNGAFQMVSNTVQNGSVVQCKNFGAEWYIDGDKLAGNWSTTWQSANAVPAISGKGEWTITAVELEA